MKLKQRGARLAARLFPVLLRCGHSRDTDINSQLPFVCGKPFTAALTYSRVTTSRLCARRPSKYAVPNLHGGYTRKKECTAISMLLGCFTWTTALPMERIYSSTQYQHEATSHPIHTMLSLCLHWKYACVCLFPSCTR
ncbi:hypothetical protein BDZ91DRAFT_427293 [Kalaharituber pfeilii]|nr:hypothetical protein BDZ91DRAFT_427293 [Kalaharituber pfeilii]